MNYKASFDTLSTSELSYDVRSRRTFRKDDDELSILDSFFDGQNLNYCQELDQLIQTCGINECCKIGIVMPCSFESGSIEGAINSLDAVLRRRQDVSLLIVLNANAGTPAQHDNNYVLRNLIWPLQEQYGNLKCVNLSFDPRAGCLGRARKYGMDIFLRHFSNLRIRGGKILFLESDMVSCDQEIIERYEEVFSKTEYCLLQGKILFPDYCNNSLGCSKFLNNRDTVVRALGANMEKFPLFMGPMVIGRNFCVRAGAAAAANSIDAFPFAGAEDDIIFGMDIAMSSGGMSKKALIDTAVVTNPRRELFALFSLYKSDEWDHLLSYHSFLNEELFRPTNEELMFMVEEMSRHESRFGVPDEKLAEPFWEWIKRAALKERLPPGIKEPILADYIFHKAGYWATEAKFEGANNHYFGADCLEALNEAKEILNDFHPN